ncbi:Putative efflux protein [Campylobacter concisus UNSWCD]|uniref:MFS transporter n=1 Tax=Campylobacter concisus TaxID=199 RepID=UPI00025A6984|nr:MFS transporter [Campylobacter concisus]EIF06778.1 Putative efflux protein [Campylobacter concisus UNSWCD]
MLKSVLPLSFIVASRFFGLFIVLPVLSLYALNLEGANEFLVGLIVGVYAISQMIFQVPFGALSDKIGRKKALTIGLLIFVVGSIVCALASEIYTMLFGRFLQGVGAVGAVATAMISDFVAEENRSKAMAIMGAFIGLSFTFSMVLGPLLARSYGLSSLFYLSAALSLLCVVLLYTVVPKEIKVSAKAQKVPFGKLFLQKDYMIINFTSFMQKMLTSIAFLVIPIVLVREYGFESSELYKVYALGAALGFLAMGLAGALGDGKGLSKVILIAGTLLFAITYAIFALSFTKFLFVVGIAIFFVGFNLHEPIMQSTATKFVKSSQKGTALGIFNSFGYFGSFIGGAFGGYIMHAFDFKVLATICVVLCVIWLVLLFSLSDPRIFKNIYLSPEASLNLELLNSQKGVVDYYKNEKNQVIKFDSRLTSEAALKESLKF